MAIDFDVIIRDTVSGEISEAAALKPMGGSEYGLIQLSRELEKQGLSVAICSKGTVLQTYGPHPERLVYDPAAAMSCKTLIVSRYSTIPKNIHSNRIVIAATDMPGAGGTLDGGSYRHLGLPANTFVFLTSWHASLFPVSWNKKVIPLMVDDVCYDEHAKLPRVNGKFVYASAAMKGLTETLKWWKTFCEEFPNEMKGRVLHVGTNWDDPPVGAFDDIPQVQWVGRLHPAKTEALLSDAEGLFYVNVFPETFCAVAAVAQASGARVHALCIHDLGGLPETTLSEFGVTRDKEAFAFYFLRARLQPTDSKDFRPSTLIPRWLEVLQLKDSVEEFFSHFKKNLVVAKPLGESPRKPTVGLVLIAKNEASILPRAIGSGRNIVDTFTVVVDQKNTDDTFNLKLEGGSIRVAPTLFGGHAAARNEAVVVACNANPTDFVLMLDADDTLEGNMPEGGLDHSVDGYEIEILDGNVQHARLALFKPDRGFKYVRRAHEYLEPPAGALIKKLGGLYIRRGDGGDARRTPESTKAKFLHDIELLQQDFLEFGDNDGRTLFYVAQSHLDVARACLTLGETDLAKQHFHYAQNDYTRRIVAGGWAEEIFISHMKVASIAEYFSDWPKAKLHYLTAMEVIPARRAEPATALMNLYNLEQKYFMASMFSYGCLGQHDSPPPKGLFVDVEVYQWRMLLEMSLTLWHLGDKGRSGEFTQKLIESPYVPEGTKKVLKKNLENCK